MFIVLENTIFFASVFHIGVDRCTKFWGIDNRGPNEKEKILIMDIDETMDCVSRSIYLD